MRASRVVCLKNLPDEQKEIVQPAGRQSCLDGRCPFPFTQLSAAHMRMRHVIASLGIRWLFSNHVVGVGEANPVPTKDNPKRP
jgi:hypothetical protein